MPRVNALLSWAAVSLVVSAVGCGGAQGAPPQEPTTSAPPPASTSADLGPPAQTTTTDGLSSGGTGGAKLPPAGPTSEPGRSPDEIAVQVKARREEIRACYDKALAARPGIEGGVHVRWLIDPKGEVKDVAIDEARSAFVDVGMGKCIADVLKGLKFPESPKGMETRAHYPFNFNPRSGGKTKAPK